MIEFPLLDEPLESIDACPDPAQNGTMERPKRTIPSSRATNES